MTLTVNYGRKHYDYLSFKIMLCSFLAQKLWLGGGGVRFWEEDRNCVQAKLGCQQRWIVHHKKLIYGVSKLNTCQAEKKYKQQAVQN